MSVTSPKKLRAVGAEVLASTSLKTASSATFTVNSRDASPSCKVAPLNSPLIFIVAVPLLAATWMVAAVTTASAATVTLDPLVIPTVSVSTTFPANVTSPWRSTASNAADSEPLMVEAVMLVAVTDP